MNLGSDASRRHRGDRTTRPSCRGIKRGAVAFASAPFTQDIGRANSRRVQLWIDDGDCQVEIRFRGKRCAMPIGSNAAKFLLALYEQLPPGKSVLDAHAACAAIWPGEEICFRRLANLRQVVCRLNKTVEQELGPAPDSTSRGSDAWILSFKNEGYQLNPNVSFVSYEPPCEWHVRTGKKQDIATFARDLIEPDEEASEVVVSANPSLKAIPPTSWKQDRQWRQTSPLRASIHAQRQRPTR